MTDSGKPSKTSIKSSAKARIAMTDSDNGPRGSHHTIASDHRTAIKTIGVRRTQEDRRIRDGLRL